MSGFQSGNFAGEIWLQWFGCCTNQPTQQRKRQAVQRSRARIDRSMIGYPMNFQHTVHIGTGDLEVESSHLDALQGQMQSKGGYGKAYVVKKVYFHFAREKKSMLILSPQDPLQKLDRMMAKREELAGLLRGGKSGLGGTNYVPFAIFIDSSNLSHHTD